MIKRLEAFNRSAWAGIIAVLLLAAAARIINVGGWTVWTDEAWSIWASSEHDFGVVIDRLAQDRHPPAYFLALSAWSSVAGESRLALRMLNVLGGVLTVAVSYRIGRDAFGHRAGYFAALLLAVLSIPVYYTQEIRHYGWLTLSVSLMALCFLRYLRRPRTPVLIAYALSVTFMLYTQYIGLLALAVQGAYGLLLWRGSLRDKARLIGAWALAGVLYLPWLIVTSQHLANLVGGGGLNNYAELYRSTLDNLIRVPNDLLDGQFALLGGAYALGVIALVRGRQGRERWYIVLGGAGLFLAMFIVNLWIGLLAPRGMVFLMPLIVIVSGFGLTRIEPITVRRVLVGAAVVAVLATYQTPQPRVSLDAAARQIAAGYAPGDLIVLEADWDNYTLQYELRRLGIESDVFLTWRKPDYRLPNPDPLFSVEPVLGDYRRAWIVQWLQPPVTLDLLASGYDGFRQAFQTDVDLGTEYGTRFDDTTATVALFERVDEAGEIATFGDQFVLRDALFETEAEAGASLPVDLWWMALETPALDYSVGVYLLDGGGTVVAQHDAAPGFEPTTSWMPGALVFDRHPLAIPPDLPDGTYTIAVSIYWYGDQQPIAVDGQPYAVIGEIKIGA